MADDNEQHKEDGENVRRFLGHFINLRVIDITQQDDEEFEENGESRVYFHFENGECASFPVNEDGFTIHDTD